MKRTLTSRIAADAGRVADLETGRLAFRPARLNGGVVRWLDADYDIRRWTEFGRGGHFAALEEPDLLVDDVRAFFRPLR